MRRERIIHYMKNELNMKLYEYEYVCTYLIGINSMNLTQLLSDWCVPEDVIDSFQRNAIDESHLPHLTVEQLKELCPIMGIRINLAKKISEYLEAQAPTESVTTGDDSSIVRGEIQEVSVVGDVTDISFSLSDIFPCQSSFGDFDLNTLLMTSPCGKSILQYYTVNGSLDTKRRNRLTDLIIRHLFTHIVNHKLTYDDYNILAGKIITLFPKETAATYFTKPIKKSDSHTGKSVAARGKLIDKVRNILHESGERKRKISVAPTTEPNNRRNRRPLDTSQIDLELYREDIEWLSNNSEPWPEVIQKWKSTVKTRQSREYVNIQDMIAQWSILNNPSAVELIEEDFKFLYPDKTENFTKNWHTFFDKLTTLKKSEINGDASKETLFASLNYIDLQDGKIPTQLKLLVQLVPPKGRYSKNDKISVQECLDTIMIIVENPADINKTVTEQKEKALQRKQPVQPYLIILGTIQNITQLYLVVDKIRYSFHSPQRAFDVLFKCYHVFNAKYPKASDHILLILQRCIYDITTKYDNVVPYIADILITLQN